MAFQRRPFSLCPILQRKNADLNSMEMFRVKELKDLKHEDENLHKELTVMAGVATASKHRASTGLSMQDKQWYLDSIALLNGCICRHPPALKIVKI